MTITYSKRENAFEKGQHVWSVEDDCLIWTRPSGDSLTLLWKDVGAVRAAFTPSRLKRWRHVFELTTRKGSRLLIDNGHFRAIGDFEDRSASFIPFVLACLDRVIAHAPDAKASVGESPGGYMAQLAFAGSMLALMTYVLIVLPTPLGWLIIVKLLLIAAMIPLAIRWAIRSRPRKAPLTVGGLQPGLPGLAGKLL